MGLGCIGFDLSDQHCCANLGTAITEVDAKFLAWFPMVECEW